MNLLTYQKIIINTKKKKEKNRLPEYLGNPSDDLNYLENYYNYFEDNPEDTMDGKDLMM